MIRQFCAGLGTVDDFYCKSFSMLNPFNTEHISFSVKSAVPWVMGFNDRDYHLAPYFVISPYRWVAVQSLCLSFFPTYCNACNLLAASGQLIFPLRDNKGIYLSIYLDY